MRLGFYQTRSPAGDIPAGLATIETALKSAASSDVDMLVMPELFLPGYDATVTTCVELSPGSQEVISGLCNRHGVALTIGLPEAADGALFNSAFSFGDDGKQLATYRKIQLYGDGEAGRFSPGDTYCTFDYHGTRFGVLICYDVEFPEHVRALASRGAEVILVPTANIMPFVNVQQIAVPARAMENAITIVYANYCGTEGALTFTGLSGIFGPDGYSLATKGQDPGLCIATLPGGWSEHAIPLSTQRADLRRIDKNT